jgi:outer membrane receptor protein involved in Fe transport
VVIWKVSGTAPLPWGFNAGWLLHHESGGTWNARAYTNFGPDVFVDPPGVRRRLPSRNLIDLRFEKQFPIYRGQVRFTIDVFNLFNSDAPIRVLEFIQDSRFGTPSIRVDPRQYRLGVRYTF